MEALRHAHGKDEETDRLQPHPTLRAYYRNEGERRQVLDDLFDRTASHYDRITQFMSFGSGAWHRRQALLRAGLAPSMMVLDVAVGTGAVAREALGIVKPMGRVVGVDPSTGMLAEARRLTRIPLVQGLAEHLPFRAVLSYHGCSRRPPASRRTRSASPNISG